MTLTTMSALLREARDRGAGIGAFNVILLEHAEAMVAAAESTVSPVMLQLSQNCVAYHGSLAPIAAATLALARASTADVVVHLDHAEDPALIEEALELGIPSVMFDGSKLDDAENVETTRRIVAMCHERGVDVEAELGEIGGKDGVHAAGARTDPDEAARFVERTGVDALAVAVGSSHAKRERDLSLDHGLLRRIAAVVPVPLVLHGSSSLDDDEIVRAVESGMTKINLSTHLNRRFTSAVRRVLDADADIIDPRRYVGAGRAAVQEETEHLLRLLSRAPVDRLPRRGSP